MSDNHVTPTIPSSLHFPQRRYNPEEEEKREGRYRLREKRREEERTEWIGKGGRSDADARTSTVGDPESFSFLVLEMCVRLSVCPFDGLLFHSVPPSLPFPCSPLFSPPSLARSDDAASQMKKHMKD